MDMWSLGCILAELLHFLNHANDRDKMLNQKYARYLVPGESCYPLSPRRDMSGKPQRVDFGDQMRHILDIVENPSKDDLAFLSKQMTKKYISELIKITKRSFSRQAEITQFQNIKERFSGVRNQGLVELLDGMLQLNPAFRLTARECLQHKIFEKFKNKRPEPNVMEMPLYADDQYDYEYHRHTGLQYEDLKKLLILEAQLIQKRHTINVTMARKTPFFIKRNRKKQPKK